MYKHYNVTLNIKCWQHLHEWAVCDNIFKQTGRSSLLALMALTRRWNQTHNRKIYELPL